MANLQVKDGAGAAKYLKATGAGTDLDPTIPEHKETSAASILAAAQAIQAAAADIKAAVEGTLDVSGSVAVSSAPTTAITAAALPLPTGAATAANQATAIGHLATIAGVAGDALTDTELRASPVPVSGTVTASGPLTDTQLRASAVPVEDANSDALLTAVQAIQTAAEILDNTVSGSETQVDVVAALPAGENLIGLVGTSDIVVTVTPTCDTNAYTSGDLLFDSTEVANAVRANGYSCVLQSVTIVDKDDQKAAMTLLIADAATDFGTLNSAPDPDDTEAATVIGWVPVVAADYVDLGGASVACIRNIGLTLKAGASATSLYVAAITGGTPTHSAAGLVLKLGLLRS